MLWVYLILVFCLTLFSALALARYAKQLQLIAVPGEHRQHQAPTPMVGGLAIYLGLMLGLLLIDNSFARLLPCLFLLCVVGALDDRYSLPSWTRFMVQGLAAYLMIQLTGVELQSLGYIISPENELVLGRWSTPMTIFAVIGVINAVNMSDGLDGLAGSLVSIILLGLMFIGNPNQGLILITLASLLAFLSLNLRIGRQKAKVFMGDAGSTMLGLLLAYLLIQHSQFTQGIWPVTALWFLTLPLIDAVAVLLVRPLRGRSPFAADRSHYHHQIVDRGASVNLTLAIAIASQAIFICFGVVQWQLRIAEHLQLLVFLILFVIYVLSLIWFTRKKTL